MDPLTALKQAPLDGPPDAIGSTVQLQINPKEAHLGVPKEITAATPRAASRDFANLGVRGTITHLEHGIYGGKPASLIAIQCYFLFDSTSERSRITKAEIRMVCDTFEEESKSKSQRGNSQRPDPPRVVRFCPKELQGQSTRKTISKTFEAKIETSIAPIVASLAAAGISGGYSVTETHDKDFEMTVKGKPWSTSRNEVPNAVIWNLNENTAIGKGIPDEVNLALLVQHEGAPFQATLEIVVKTKAGVGLFGRPWWSKPNPLVFKPAATIGTALGLRSLDELEDRHWKVLAPHYGPLQAYRLTDASEEVLGQRVS